MARDSSLHLGKWNPDGSQFDSCFIQRKLYFRRRCRLWFEVPLSTEVKFVVLWREWLHFFSCTFCRKSRLWCNYSQVIENLEDFSIKLTFFLYSILFLLHVFCHISCHRKIFFKTNIKDFQTPIKPTIWHLFRNDFISIQVSTSPARNSSWRNELGAAHWAFFYCFLETGKTMFAFIFIFSLRKKDRQTGQKHLIVEKLIIQKWTTIKFIDARG